jgi:ornithine decarboxylase
MDLAFKEMETEVEQRRRMSLELDAREQMAFTASFLKDYSEPLLVVSESRLRNNARRFKAAMPRVRPHFAVKANPHPELLRIFKEEGLCFEIASIAELDAMIDLGTDLDTVFYSNPIKSPASVKRAAAAGIKWYVVDTPEEVEKIARIKPDAKLYLRIEVSNEGSVFPLTRKFGAKPSGIPAVINAAKSNGMALTGVTFHVGSQCNNIANWTKGINAVKGVFTQLEHNGWTPELLNIGGGYPLLLSTDDPTIEEIGMSINEQLKSIPDSVQIMGEPGRFLVGSAGCLVTQVIGLATRDEQRWVYLDTGFYGGLMEMAESFPLKIISERTGEAHLWTLAGPTCDSIDVLGEHSLPSNTEVEDILYIPNLGAYCTTCACDFNGFPVPEMVVVA